MTTVLKRSLIAGVCGMFALLTLSATVDAALYQWDNDPDGVKVFILAGQSNMVGSGKSEYDATNNNGLLGTLRYMAINDTDGVAPHYRNLLENPSDPENSDWRTRSDVKVWWKFGYIGATRTIRKGDLRPAFGNSSTWFGPEYAFGEVVGDYYDSPVLLLKTAWGGIDLVSGFRPPSAVAARGGVVGPYYTQMLADAHECLSNLGTAFPEWSGMGYQIAGIGWHQGYNDRISSSASQEYKDNLPDLISDLRAEFGNPNLPFSIGTTGMGGTIPPESYPYPNYSLVEQAQLWVAGVAQPPYVASDDTRPYWRDPSVSPSNFGYHWNHNAETHFLIGYGMANNITELFIDPNAPVVDAGPDKITWSGEPVAMDPNVIEQSGSTWTNLTYEWTADPADGVSFDNPAVQAPTVTITKATSNPSPVTLTLEVNNLGRTEPGVFDTLQVDLYDDACEAAIGSGSTAIMVDIIPDCIVDLADFAIIAGQWLVDGKLGSAQKM